MTTESKNRVASLFAQYVIENASPTFWIERKNVTSEEKELFLSLCRDREEFSKALDQCEKLHP